SHTNPSSLNTWIQTSMERHLTHTPFTWISACWDQTSGIYTLQIKHTHTLALIHKQDQTHTKQKAGRRARGTQREEDVSKFKEVCTERQKVSKRTGRQDGEGVESTEEEEDEEKLRRSEQ
ncbi:hypothetical protein ILYODFUR_008307, partial [Ilyodon furcidens]